MSTNPLDRLYAHRTYCAALTALARRVLDVYHAMPDVAFGIIRDLHPFATDPTAALAGLIFILPPSTVFNAEYDAVLAAARVLHDTMTERDAVVVRSAL